MTHPYYYYVTEKGAVKILIPIIMSQEKNTECDIDNCPGLLEQASQSCVVCQAVVHPTYFMSSVRKLNEYPSSCHDEVFCSGVCCNWQGKEGLNLEAIRKERSELAALLKKDLVKLASTAQVRVTQRVNNASRQMSKPMMVRRLVAAKFGAGVEEATKPAAKTIHDKFRLLNCLFSDEIGALAASAETVSRADLDNGTVGGKSNYWKVVAQRFHEGFPEGSVDGKVFADKVHFLHPNIQQHHETVIPAVHGCFSSEELRKMWKDIQSDYDKVMINFTKSGNHNSNFTKAAIIALRDQGLLETTEEDFDDADDLRMWLNERPGLVNFVSRQIPGQIQVDSMATSAAAVSETKNSQTQRRSPDLLASAIKELAEARKRPTESVDPRINESINKILKFSTKKEEIDLITMQINGLKQRMEATLDNVKKDRYAQGIEALEEKLDELLFKSTN